MYLIVLSGPQISLDTGLIPLGLQIVWDLTIKLFGIGTKFDFVHVSLKCVSHHFIGLAV